MMIIATLAYIQCLLTCTSNVAFLFWMVVCNSWSGEAFTLRIYNRSEKVEKEHNTIYLCSASHTLFK